MIGVIVDAIGRLSAAFHRQAGGRRLYAGAAVAQYSGDAMRQLRPHDPFRVVEEGNLYERPLLAEMWFGGSALEPEAEASASASELSFCSDSSDFSGSFYSHSARCGTVGKPDY